MKNLIFNREICNHPTAIVLLLSTTIIMLLPTLILTLNTALLQKLTTTLTVTTVLQI